MHQCSAEGFFSGTQAEGKNMIPAVFQICVPVQACWGRVRFIFSKKALSKLTFTAFLLLAHGSYCACVCVWCTALVTYGLRQSVSGGRQSLRWVGLKTSDAWLRGPGSSSRRLLLLSAWVCACLCACVCMCVSVSLIQGPRGTEWGNPG